MKKFLRLLGICLLLATVPEVSAQIMNEPEIDEQNRVIFTVEAPNAKVVKVINLSDEKALGAAEYSLSKGDDGIWMVRTNPCRPGLHYYKLSIDGFECADPNSALYYGWARWSSCIEIPDKDLDFYLPHDTPKGNVLIHWYWSDVTQKTRKCLVYTPPGYSLNSEQRYPVLYLQHGSGESELGWTMQGKVNFIMDNLIAEGKATPMIIVMDNGYAPLPEAENQSNPRGGENGFEEMLLNDLIPEIDGSFRTLTSRESRALAGLSMGAGQAQRIGFSNLDVFASIGAFSGGMRNFDIETAYSGLFSDAKQFNDKVKLYWFGAGDLERAHVSGAKLHELFEEYGLKHHWFVTHGSHEWQVWRHHMHDFAQKLFN